MSDRLASLEAALLWDPGQRGISKFAPQGVLLPAARSLQEATRVGITSGFPVLPSGTPETDGPLGALALGQALTRLGSEVFYFCDPPCRPLFQALAAAPLAELALSPQLDDPSQDLVAREFLLERAPTHLVAIERPARASDRRYLNMRGQEISSYTSALDALFRVAPRLGVITLGIGDGGNEIGLGTVYDAVCQHVTLGPTIAATVATDHTIVAGVSTWGAYGLVGSLSLLSGRDLLPTPAEVSAQLQALVAAGALDGITGRNEATLDGLPLSDTLQLLSRLRQAISPEASPGGAVR